MPNAYNPLTTSEKRHIRRVSDFNFIMCPAYLPYVALFLQRIFYWKKREYKEKKIKYKEKKKKERKSNNFY